MTVQEILTNTWSFLQFLRFRFLLSGPVYFGFGVALAQIQYNTFSALNYLIGQSFCFYVHACVHMINDYCDYDADLKQREYAIAESSSQWTGGGGALVEKRISLTTAFYCAHGGFLIALIWALYLPNTEAMGLGMLMIITGFFYSSPPLRLCCKGLGELIVALNLVFLEGNMGYVLQGGKLYAKETIVFVPIFLIAFFRQLMMNMPDLKTDKMVGKATLAVYLGHVISARVHLFGFALVYMMMPFLCFYYPVPKMWIAFMYVLSLPWGASITYRLNMQPSHLPLLEILAKESSLHLAWTASCTTFAYMTVECLENTCDWYKGLPPLFWMTTVGTIVIFKLKI